MSMVEGSLYRWGLWISHPPLRNSRAEYPLSEFLWARSDTPPRRVRAPQSPSAQGDPLTTVPQSWKRAEGLFAPAGVRVRAVAGKKGALTFVSCAAKRMRAARREEKEGENKELVCWWSGAVG